MSRYKIVDPEQVLERLGIRFDVKGSMLWANCPHPDHDERTPSWRVQNDPEHEKYTQHRCYGCGWGGWPVHLVETVLGCTRSEAVEWLKDVEQDPPLPFAVTVDYQSSAVTHFVLPPGVDPAPVQRWPDDARNYLLEDRGVAEWQATRWGMRVADGRYHEVLNPLAGRIVIPVRTAAGKLISYTARSYVGSHRRYKEPSKREGADLGAVFGEEHWPAVDLRRVVVVTEGAFDALAVERAYPYSLPIAGIYGSQLLPGHISRLSTFGAVLMATDPDKAGNTVARALESELSRWAQVIRVQLPEGEDAASLSKKDPTALHTLIGEALHGVRLSGVSEVVVERSPPRRRRVAKAD